jgi:hypothetical protein
LEEKPEVSPKLCTPGSVLSQTISGRAMLKSSIVSPFLSAS